MVNTEKTQISFEELQELSDDELIEICDRQDAESYLRSRQVTSWGNNCEYFHESWVKLATFSPRERENGHGKITVLVCKKSLLQ